MPKDRDEDLPSTLQKSPAKANWEPKGNQATEEVLERLQALPAGRTYENVQDAWGALGGTVEHRF
jgi:hypothetical protein